MDNNVSALLEEIIENTTSSYNKFFRQLNKNFNKIISSYELNAKQLADINAGLALILNKIKSQGSKNKKSIINEIESLVSQLDEPSININAINFDFKGYWRGNWYIDHDNCFGIDNCLVNNDMEYGRTLKVLHKSGSSSAKISPNNPGLQFFNVFQEKYRHLSIEYKLKFEEGFRFCRGGRLPGLYGGHIFNESQIPDGTNGFLSKLAWTNNEFGEVILNKANGQNLNSYRGGNWKFCPGKWHTLKQELYLNDHDKHNGYIRVLFDGREVVLVSGICFRTSDAIKIKGIAFTNYYGENDPLATCPQDTFIEFSNFIVCPLKI